VAGGPDIDRDIDREATEKCKLANKKMAQFLNWDNSEIEQFSNLVIFKFIIGVPANRKMRNGNFIFRKHLRSKFIS
jgi:hypothetical protein